MQLSYKQYLYGLRAMGRATEFGEVKQYRRLKGKSADINVDGGNLISSTLFVCAVHFLSWEQYEIVSPSPASQGTFIVWFCCPVHSLAIVCSWRH